MPKAPKPKQASIETNTARVKTATDTKGHEPALKPKVEADTRTQAQKFEDVALSQSERFIAKARELGLDEREEVFDEALTKVASHRPSDKPKAEGQSSEPPKA